MNSAQLSQPRQAVTCAICGESAYITTPFVLRKGKRLCPRCQRAKSLPPLWSWLFVGLGILMAIPLLDRLGIAIVNLGWLFANVIAAFLLYSIWTYVATILQALAALMLGCKALLLVLGTGHILLRTQIGRCGLVWRLSPIGGWWHIVPAKAEKIAIKLLIVHLLPTALVVILLGLFGPSFSWSRQSSQLAPLEIMVIMCALHLTFAFIVEPYASGWRKKLRHIYTQRFEERKTFWSMHINAAYSMLLWDFRALATYLHQEAVSLDANAIDTRQLAAYISLYDDDFQQAITQAKAILWENTRSDMNTAICLMIIGQSFLYQKQPDSARPYVREAFAYAPWGCRQVMGVQKLFDQEPELALKYLTEARKQSGLPRDQAILEALLSITLLFLKREREAEQLLTRAMKHGIDDAPYLYEAYALLYEEMSFAEFFGR